MHINSINFATPFSGIARIDYKKTEAEISKCPPQTREAIRENINTLKDSFEKGPDKVADISFSYKPNHDILGWQGIGKINVAGENQTASSEFSLREDTTLEEIWGNGFKNITKEVLDNSFDVDDSKTDEIIYKIIDGVIHENKYATNKIINKNNEEIRKEVREIADLIKRTPRVDINKYEAATAIYLIRNSGYKNPNELTNCLVNNLNQLIARFENDLPEGEYKMSIHKGNYYYSEKKDYEPPIFRIALEEIIDDSLPNYSERHVHVEMGYPYKTQEGEKIKFDADIDNIDEGFQKLYNKFIQ